MHGGEGVVTAIVTLTRATGEDHTATLGAAAHCRRESSLTKREVNGSPWEAGGLHVDLGHHTRAHRLEIMGPLHPALTSKGKE